MKRTTIMILMMTMVLMVISTGLMAAAKKPAYSEPVTTGAEIGGTASSGAGNGDAGTASCATESAGTMDTVVIQERQDDVTTDDVGGSAHISEQADSAVQLYLIPILVLIMGFIKVQWDKDRFRKILFITWGLVKECDNLFANPAASLQSQIRLVGVNPAKKNWVKDQLNRQLSDSQVSLAKKKVGTLDHLIELAITTFKYGGPAVSGLLKIIKRW